MEPGGILAALILAASILNYSVSIRVHLRWRFLFFFSKVLLPAVDVFQSVLNAKSPEHTCQKDQYTVSIQAET